MARMAQPLRGAGPGHQWGLVRDNTDGGANRTWTAGTVFKITPGGTLTTLYSFCSQSGCTDGADPYAGLVQATNGDFYGTTDCGGANGAWHGLQNHPEWHADDAIQLLRPKRVHGRRSPLAGLVQATNGDFYGTTRVGGANGSGHGLQNHPEWHADDAIQLLLPKRVHGRRTPPRGWSRPPTGTSTGQRFLAGSTADGTVFKITPSGTLTTLYSFCSQSECTDGAQPEAGLVQATNGDFYGTTSVWRGQRLLRWDGLQNHPEWHADDAVQLLLPKRVHGRRIPQRGLVQATNGNFYGTTDGGGANGVWDGLQNHPEWHADDAIQLLLPKRVHGRRRPRRGAGPGHQWDLLRDNRWLAGTSGDGTVFSLSVGLGPFVETQTTSGEVGAAVKILGTDLTGATSVSFNGTAATFTVVSPS